MFDDGTHPAVTACALITQCMAGDILPGLSCLLQALAHDFYPHACLAFSPLISPPDHCILLPPTHLSSNPVGMGVQARALMLQARAGVTNPLLAFTAAYTASGPANGAGGGVSSLPALGGMDAGSVVVALAAYDASRKSLVREACG